MRAIHRSCASISAPAAAATCAPGLRGRTSGRSYDIELAGRLWRVSEELTGLRQPA